MTPKEVLEHNWTVGERLWEVCFAYDSTIGGLKPLGVVEVEVVKIERDDRWKSDWEYISLKLKPVGCCGNFLPVDLEDLTYEATVICAMVNHDKTYGDSYSHLRFCTHKSFDRSIAEERFKKEVAKWNKRAKAWRTKQLSQLDELMKELEKQQKLVNSIDLDKILIK